MGLGANIIKLLDSIRPSPFTEHDKYVDKLELGYIVNIVDLFRASMEVPGHIVELGTASGRNALLFGNLIKLYGYETRKQYIGFDSFSSYTPKDLEVHPYLSESRWAENSLKKVQNRVDRLGLSETIHLVPGDIRETVPKFFKPVRQNWFPEGKHMSVCYTLMCLRMNQL